MLNAHGDLSIAELVFYTPVLPIALFVGFKHGLGRSSGWFFLIILALIRIIGAIMTIVVETETSPSATLAAVAATLATVGLSPLTLCTLGILKRLHNEMQYKPINPRIFFILGALPIVGLALSVVGGVHISSTTDPSQISSALTYLEVASILFVVVVVLLTAVTGMTGMNIEQILPSDRKLFYAVAFSMPFLIVRTVYSVLASYNYTNFTSPFNSRTGSIYAQAFMATFEEFIVVITYISAGLVTPKPIAAPQHADPNNKLAGSDHEQGYARPAYPMQGYGQQTGRVGV